MILESFLVFVTLFFIAVLFYKQANEEFQILQLEASRIEEVPTLYADHSPIVIRGLQSLLPPTLGTEESLSKRPHILQRSITPGMSLKQLLQTPAQLASYQMNPLTAEWLAQESGLKIWFDQSLFHKLLPSPYTQWMYSNSVQLWPHHRGLFKTTAFQTLILPTQGTVTVSLLLQKMLPYLPKQWEGRQFTSLSLVDTPLLSQIEFIDVKLRTGTALLVPAHVLVSISPAEDTPLTPWTAILQIHHPISLLAR
jgi:hypothetical protein